ncbi:BQ5605_C017g08302 [Microbotryum silenes-dioicae]|uniref:BQ5605_C017g08302 protein n=1 Tax=Microbotryum silenes-dioicae TaxID=796604 RepID=A0A2X0NXW3_9BASI|nr:BQ5605_C017g08302 [Microbotryum silenes-dioicae]
MGPLGATLLSSPLGPAPINKVSSPRVMTTTNRSWYCDPYKRPPYSFVERTAWPQIALKPLKPHVSIRDDLAPQAAVCTHCKAWHLECERICSQGKVQLPSPPQPNLEYRQLLEGSGSEAKAFRENARSYNNAVPFTSLAAHWDQTQVGTLGPPVFRVLCSNMADRPGRGHRHSTWTRRRRQSHATIYFDKLESILRTGNRFVREFASAKARAGWDTAKEWILRLCLRPGRDRRTHNLPTSSTEMAMLICDSDTKTGDRGRQNLILQVHARSIRLRCLRYSLLFPAGEDGFHPNIPLCGFNQAGPPIARNREQIDNGVQLREVLAGLGLDDGGEEEDKDRDDEDEDGEEAAEEDGDGERQVKGSRWRVSRSQLFAHYLPNATSTSQSRIAPNVPSWSL